MNKAKDFLASSLGMFGIILWYIVALVVSFLPLFLLDLPILLILALEFVIMYFPIVGFFLLLAAWVLSFFTLGDYPTFISVIYYIALAIYVAFDLAPTITKVSCTIINHFKSR